MPAWLEMDRKVCPTATTSLQISSRDYHKNLNISSSSLIKEEKICYKHDPQYVKWKT